MERERREDLEARDAFAQRVIQRDKEKRRNTAVEVQLAKVNSPTDKHILIGSPLRAL